MAAMMKNLSRISRILLLLTVAMSTPLMAQLGEDPTSIPFPEFGIYDPDRAVVMTVQFNSNIDVELLDVIVANTRAPSSIGDPPLLLLELLDHNGELIATQNAWHPLWERQWDETGSTESGNVASFGRGTFYVPLSETLAAVRISDIELGQELITIDVFTVVGAYCAATPGTPICALFISSFE